MRPSHHSQTRCRAEAVAWGARPPFPKATDWRPITKDTRRGFFTLRLVSGLTIQECVLHEKAARRWIALPGRAQIDPDGKQRNGQAVYVTILEITNRDCREAFQQQALAAVDRLLGETAAEPRQRPIRRPVKKQAARLVAPMLDDPIDDLWAPS
jgi:hypothetical protein